MNYAELAPYWINHLSFALRRELASEFQRQGFDVSAEEWAMLLILSAETAQSPKDLTQKTLRDKTTVTRMLDRLEKRGWIRRTKSKADKRSLEVALTDSGREVFVQLRAITGDLVARAQAGIPDDDLQTVVQTLSQMTRNLTQEPSQ